ncbi:MAG: 2TM domain-containing protein [Candidatus Sumerlaeia bacterium]
MTDEGKTSGYTEKELDEIIRRALKHQARKGHLADKDDLYEIGAKMGLSPSAIEAAIREYSEEGRIEEARQAVVTRKRQQFFDHFRSYLVTNAILLLIDIFTGGGWWAHWVILFWGIALAWDALDTFFPKAQQIEKAARKRMKRKG